ncbi:beta-glucosidase 24-like [Impatiens glandulifera]|uniref:beta-glucosidase 24-like n=1 Tax=Impatiens glandulifera TaxID=253017 RepID=UPI001FB06182|nr:beta-glucosidase 24-like [Impatiens glandulifera]
MSGGNADVAIDAYHRYKGDIKIMEEMGFNAYRFSFSWSRILPRGKLSGGINMEGIQYYNNLINELLDKGLVPFVTLFHWDLPEALEEEYDGFLSTKIVKDFKDYANVCFEVFGDRVKHWITLNEPWTYSMGGYTGGTLAPGRCSSSNIVKADYNCTYGNSGTEPYISAHNQLLAHSEAVKLYKEKYQAYQKGKIGITLNCDWMVSYSEAMEDQMAADVANEFMFGWFMDPITRGTYPESMRVLVGKRLPKFRKKQSEMLKGSFDFLGLNYYTSRYARYNQSYINGYPKHIITDSRVRILNERNGKLIGPMIGTFCVYPRGIRDVLLYVKNKYNNPLIYITENGINTDNVNLTLEEILGDTMRIDYYYLHFEFIRLAIKEGVNVKGHFSWSLFDNVEWSMGTRVRFGIYYVDYKNGLKRIPKHSAKWFKKFLQRK